MTATAHTARPAVVETLEVEVYPDGTTGTFEIETVDVSALRDRDEVLYRDRTGQEFFVPVTGHAFRSSHWSPRAGETVYGDWMIRLGGTRTYVKPGTTFRRAVDGRAVRQAQRAADRANLAALREYARRTAPRKTS